MKTTGLNKHMYFILAFCLLLGFSACGSGTETCNPTTTGNSCATASPTSDGEASSEEAECTDEDEDGLDDASGEDCNTTDAAVSAIVDYILKTKTAKK